LGLFLCLIWPLISTLLSPFGFFFTLADYSYLDRPFGFIVNVADYVYPA
jgi:hypothetical protein